MANFHMLAFNPGCPADQKERRVPVHGELQIFAEIQRFYRLASCQQTPLSPAVSNVEPHQKRMRSQPLSALIHRVIPTNGG